MMTEDDFHDLENWEAEWVRRERLLNPDPSYWRWSPTPLPKVREMMAVADMVAEGDPPTFFDAGCGIGTKLALARDMFGWIATGYELYDEYVEFAVREFHVNVCQANLRVNQPDYSQYDVVMTSRPFKDDDEECAWERHVQSEMRPGAILIGTHLGVKPYSWRWLYRAQWRCVAVKPVDGERDWTEVNVPDMRPRPAEDILATQG